eukprot:scaffold13805_cov136-Skeletonema_marinoi.AAC.1
MPCPFRSRTPSKSGYVVSSTCHFTYIITTLETHLLLPLTTHSADTMTAQHVIFNLDWAGWMAVNARSST